jgi:sugar lactone lactonase YvrE
MITPGGVVSTLAGGAGWGSVDGPSTLARFGGPTGIAVDRSGNVYVADTSNNTIRKITSGFVSTLAGSAGVSGSADGAGSNASFSGPTGLTTDSTGNIYVADTWNHTIRKISPSGLVSTLAGSAGNPGRADGMGAEARFTGPAGLTADAAGNIYVADFSNSTIRKVTPAGAVTTIIGVAGRSGFTPGTLPGVLAFPRAIAIRGTTLYVTLYNGLAMVSNLQ